MRFDSFALLPVFIVSVVTSASAHAGCENLLMPRQLRTLIHLRPADQVTTVPMDVELRGAVSARLPAEWARRAKEFDVRVTNPTFDISPWGWLVLRFDAKGKPRDIVTAAEFFGDGGEVFWQDTPRSIAHASAAELLALLEQPIATFHFSFSNETTAFLEKEKLVTAGQVATHRFRDDGDLTPVRRELAAAIEHLGLKMDFRARDLNPEQRVGLRQTRLLDLNLSADLKSKLAPTSIDTPERFLALSKSELTERGLTRDDRRTIKTLLKTFGLF